MIVYQIFLQRIVNSSYYNCNNYSIQKKELCEFELMTYCVGRSILDVFRAQTLPLHHQGMDFVLDLDVVLSQVTNQVGVVGWGFELG